MYIIFTSAFAIACTIRASEKFFSSTKYWRSANDQSWHVLYIELLQASHQDSDGPLLSSEHRPSELEGRLTGL